MCFLRYDRQGLAAFGLKAVFLFCEVVLSAFSVRAEEPRLSIKQSSDVLVIELGKKPLATYVAADESVARPFYANVYAPSGELVTRHFPPQVGVDPSDHATMHPGIWLAFGDLSGCDFWRNKGRVKQTAFTAAPKAEGNELSFTVRNEYIASVGGSEKKIAAETCAHRWLLKEDGILLTLDSELASADQSKPLVFGDQEEMGLGVRVATPLGVKDAGGEIVTSDGKRNEKEAWGKQAKWCDYRGKIEGRFVGISLFPHPDNFRPSWFHVRDYGLMVANPFGRSAFTRGEKSRIEVKPGDKLRLRFAVWIHSSKNAPDIATAYQAYVTEAK